MPVGDTPKKNAAADIASIASLGRNMIEIYNFFYYLDMDDISSEEANFRLLVADYHYRHEMQKVGEKMEFDKEEVDKHKETALKDYRAKIEGHQFFKKIPPEIRKTILKGDRAAYISRTEITRKYCSNVNQLDAHYKILSNHVHSGVYGLRTSFDGSTYGCDNEKNRGRIAGILFIVNYYVGMAASSILMRFPENTNDITKYFQNKEEFLKASKIITKLIMRF